MWHDLQEFKVRTHLPVVACLMDVGAGGAYYLSTGADHVVAHPTTITGGIGVILNLYNLEDAMAQFNVVGTPIKAGENVDLGTPIKPPSEAARAILQRMANEFHERFRRIVIERHPQLAHAPPDVFDGRVFTAQQALDLGLIESIGYLDQAAETARELGGAPGAPLILLHRPNDGARTPYDVTANVPIQTSFLPLSLPGLERRGCRRFFISGNLTPRSSGWAGGNRVFNAAGSEPTVVVDRRPSRFLADHQGGR